MSKFTSTYLNAYYQLASRALSYVQIFHAFLCPKIYHGGKLIAYSQDLDQFGLRKEMQTWSWCGFGFLWVWITLSWVGEAWESRKLSCLRASKSKKNIRAKPLLPWWNLYRRITSSSKFLFFSTSGFSRFQAISEHIDVENPTDILSSATHIEPKMAKSKPKTTCEIFLQKHLIKENIHSTEAQSTMGKRNQKLENCHVLCWIHMVGIVVPDAETFLKATSDWNKDLQSCCVSHSSEIAAHMRQWFVNL